MSSPSFYPSTTSRADCKHFQFLKARSIQCASYSSSQLLSALHPFLGSGALAERREREGNAPLNCPPTSVVLSPLWVPYLRLPLLARWCPKLAAHGGSVDTPRGSWLYRSVTWKTRHWMDFPYPSAPAVAVTLPGCYTAALLLQHLASCLHAQV